MIGQIRLLATIYRKRLFLPIFFKEIAHQNGVSDVNATAFWGYATSCGTLICAVLAPFMGTLGDFKGMKKKLFTTFMLLGVISSALLAFTGDWKALLVLYVLGTLGFNGSCVYYDSFLLDVTTEEPHGPCFHAGLWPGVISEVPQFRWCFPFC